MVNMDSTENFESVTYKEIKRDVEEGRCSLSNETIKRQKCF
jgi:hypothetical protein